MTERADPPVFQIRSNSGGTEVVIEGADVRLSSRALRASVSVCELEKDETVHGLNTFFESLARDWRGWKGERIWSSLEGEFHITALHNGLGTVELIVSVGHREPTSAGVWDATVTLFFDAGGLDALARQAPSAWD